MFDYYDYVNKLSEDKLVTEIDKITKRLLSTSPTSPVAGQLQGMLDLANQAYQDSLFKSRVKKEDTVIDIGEMESVDYIPDEYSKDELMIEIVRSYLGKDDTNGK
jgi:hypothetical protein